MKTLAELHKQDARAWHNAEMLPEQYRETLNAAVPIFREASKRDAFPVTVVNDPGVLQSRHLKVIDMKEAEHGMGGTGGTFDRAKLDKKDQIAYAIWENISVPWREGLASERGGFNLLQESGQAASQIIVETENAMIIDELGPVVGLTSATGQRTFAGGNWTLGASAAYNDVVRAVVSELAKAKAPAVNVTMAVHPDRKADLYRTFDNSDAAQLQRVEGLLPGGIVTSLDIPATEAWIYPRTPSILEYRVYQDLSVIPLPKIDEDSRMRMRTIGAVHLKKEEALVQITDLTT